MVLPKDYTALNGGYSRLGAPDDEERQDDAFEENDAATDREAAEEAMENRIFTGAFADLMVVETIDLGIFLLKINYYDDFWNLIR